MLLKRETGRMMRQLFFVVKNFGESNERILQTLETKAPTRDFFASILSVLNEALTEEEFIIKYSSNFNEKEPFKDLDLDVEKLQLKYNYLKTNGSIFSDRQKSSSGLVLMQLPKWFDIINPVLPHKN